MATIGVNNLRKVYETPSGEEVAVDGVSFTAEDGEFVTIVGPSGCGKTTLLRCIAGLTSPTSGDITFDDEDVTDTIPQRRRLGMVFQSIALYSHMTAAENISYPLKVRGVNKDIQQARLEEAANMLQISDYIDKKPPELSGGQQQRVALARCLVQQPRAFLFDEPTSNLDAKLKVEIRKEIQKVAKETNDTMIYVTHDQEEAMTMSDKIIVMNDGEIMQTGAPDEVYEFPNNRFVAEFIGTPTMNILSARKQDSLLSIEGVGQLELSHNSDIPDGKYTIGFRPDDAELSNNGGNITANIDLIESIGYDDIIYTESPQGEIRLLAQWDGGANHGNQEIEFKVDPEDIVWFDSNTQDAIKKGA